MYIRTDDSTVRVSRPPGPSAGRPARGPTPPRPPAPGHPPAERFGSTQSFQRPPNQQPRKRMMAQARKGHFMHDAKEVFARNPGKMEDQHVRAFLEGVFQRGTRQSTEDALLYLDTKVGDESVTKDQGNELANLIERYSFWR